MPQKRWMFDPNYGGKKIPESKKREVTQRIEQFAAENYAGQYTRLDIRFRGQFVTSTPIPNQIWVKAGHPKIGRKHEKK